MIHSIWFAQNKNKLQLQNCEFRLAGNSFSHLFIVHDSWSLGYHNISIVINLSLIWIVFFCVCAHFEVYGSLLRFSIKMWIVSGLSESVEFNLINCCLFKSDLIVEKNNNMHSMNYRLLKMYKTQATDVMCHVWNMFVHFS